MIEKIKQRLIPLNKTTPAQTRLKCAAVLLPLYQQPQNNQWQVMLTRRADHLKHHPGQISFPGGRYETSDLNLRTTALRETEEEVGIEAGKIELIGQLPQQQTTSQYNITPFVGIVDNSYQLKVDNNEVAEVFSVPLEFVIDQANQKRVTEKINDIAYTFYVIQYKHYNIWGATAKILVNLTRRLLPAE